MSDMEGNYTGPPSGEPWGISDLISWCHVVLSEIAIVVLFVRVCVYGLVNRVGWKCPERHRACQNICLVIASLL